MILAVNEADWKRFSKLRDLAKTRFYEREIACISAIAGDEAKSPMDRYHLVAESIDASDERYHFLFGVFSRSRMHQCLAAIVSFGLITPEEFATFTESTRTIVERFNNTSGENQG